MPEEEKAMRRTLSTTALLLGILFAAFGGVDTASATQLCSTNTSPCEDTSYATGTEIKAASTNFKMYGVVTTTCNLSFTNEVTQVGTPIEGEVTALSFSGCTGACGSAARLEVWRTTFKGTEGGNGWMTVKGTNGPRIKLTGCTAKKETCVFSALGATLSLTFSGGANATIGSGGVYLLLTEGTESICGFDATMTFTATVEAPAPLYLIK